MRQAKFSLSEGLMEFVDRHEIWGFPDKSSLIREALNHLRTRLKHQRLVKSADIYAEIYRDEPELQQLTDRALEQWPR